MKAVNYIGHDGHTGYGVAARALMRALEAAPTEVARTMIGYGQAAGGGPVLRDEPRSSVNGVLVHTVPEYFPHWLRVRKEAYPSAPVWGYTTWETDRLPPHWPALLNRMDGIFVPSRWNKTVFEQNGVTAPIRILPHISEFQGRTPDAPPSPALAAALAQAGGRLIFYSIGMWNERKGLPLLVQAFLEQFTAADPVCLIVKTSELDWTSYPSRWRRLFRGSRLQRTEASVAALQKRYDRPAAVITLTEELSADDLALLHRAGDCYVSLTRGEGWGMGAYDACFFGKPVIMTGYGGQLDYLPAALAELVPCTLAPVRVAYGRESYSANQRWAEPDLATARRLLQAVAARPEEAKRKGRLLQAHVTAHFTPEAVAAACLEVY